MSDLPIDEIAEMMADQLLDGATCWQKWSCIHCGSRQVMDEPNVLYRSGRCQECDKVSPIAVCGFMLAKGKPEITDAMVESIRNA